MDDALSYVSSKAPTDVIATVEWLSDNAFEVTEQTGPDLAAFGNAQLTFRRGPVGIRITSDRAQWFLDVALSGDEFVSFDRIVSAGDVASSVGRSNRSLPEQLPLGVSWRHTLPAILAKAGSN